MRRSGEKREAKQHGFEEGTFLRSLLRVTGLLCVKRGVNEVVVSVTGICIVEEYAGIGGRRGRIYIIFLLEQRYKSKHQAKIAIFASHYLVRSSFRGRTRPCIS